jgi:23S rRNA pseudouridine2605 synthase
MENKMRIAKYIAASGFCSRRDAEKIILQKRVKLNGKTIDTPAIVIDATQDKVEIDGKLIVATTQDRLFVFYKPRGIVTTHKDEKDRDTVFAQLPKHLPRLISVGRLDINSEGLLLLTTNGELARKLEHPKNAIERVYKVRVFGTIPANFSEKLERGIKIDKIKYAPIKINIISQTANNTIIEFTLTEGKNREIRNICKFFELKISKLVRIKYGQFELGKMKIGDLAEVSPKLIESLKSSY